MDWRTRNQALLVLRRRGFTHKHTGTMLLKPPALPLPIGSTPNRVRGAEASTPWNFLRPLCTSLSSLPHR